MSTSTEIAPDTAELSDLDFEPQCCLQFTLFNRFTGKQVGEPKACPEVAKWVANTPCCGKAILVCQSHYASRARVRFKCAKCDRIFYDALEWRPL